MHAAVRLAAQVQPGGKIEVIDTHLPEGASVEGIILFAQPVSTARRSLRDVLAEAPGHLVFETVEDVDTYLRAERDAWEH